MEDTEKKRVWNFGNGIEKFLEPLKWAQSWTVCHQKLEEGPGAEVQSLVLLLYNLCYYCTLYSGQLFSGLNPETLCMFPLEGNFGASWTPYLFSVEKTEHGPGASIRGNPFLAAYMPAYRREIIHNCSYHPVTLAGYK